ncbi:MAG TPA: exo-alpha-sialidase [Candidatus Eisenbacteria bacterium]|nr:exo-alpha-sialidase [Candidatus Eisenbacteria bacterium]
MPKPRHLKPRDGDVVLLVGTMKGAFLFRSDRRRKKWDMAGPYFPGQSVYSMTYDARGGRQRLWAGTGTEHWGALISSSDDFGRNWTNPEQVPIRFPEGSEMALKRIWQIIPGRTEEPNTLYAGVEPAALFRSDDAGETWSLNKGLFDHPHRTQWQPGGGGLCLHTIILDQGNPDRMWIAISTGGVYRTEDGGRSWKARNVGIKAPFLPNPEPEFGQCVHKVVSHPAEPDRMYLQHHWGIYRSDDGADTWNPIEKGVPTTFGFALAQDPNDPQTVYNLPIEADMFRATPEGKLRVYKTKNAGKSWAPLAKGLPQQEAYECVLRDGMSTDKLDPAGVYFGTRSGKVYGSANSGEKWSLIAETLPPVCCVKVAHIGGAKPAKKSAQKSANKSAKKGAAKSARRR